MVLLLLAQFLFRELADPLSDAGTLRCWCDDNGLRFEVALPRHHDAEGLAESIKRGDVTQCSFSFRTLDDDWSRDDDGTIVRRLLKVDIHDGDVAAGLRSRY
jgi:HK97 family phage prohead protease